MELAITVSVFSISNPVDFDTHFAQPASWECLTPSVGKELVLLARILHTFAS